MHAAFQQHTCAMRDNLSLITVQVPSEVLSLETRSAGYALTTFMNFLVRFLSLHAWRIQAFVLCTCYCQPCRQLNVPLIVKLLTGLFVVCR